MSNPTSTSGYPTSTDLQSFFKDIIIQNLADQLLKTKIEVDDIKTFILSIRPTLKEKIEPCKNYGDIFDALSGYWSCYNYKIIKELIKSYGNEGLKLKSSELQEMIENCSLKVFKEYYESVQCYEMDGERKLRVKVDGSICTKIGTIKTLLHDLSKLLKIKILRLLKMPSNLEFTFGASSQDTTIPFSQLKKNDIEELKKWGLVDLKYDDVHFYDINGPRVWRMKKLDERVSSIPLIIPYNYSYDKAKNALVEEKSASKSLDKLRLNEDAIKFIQEKMKQYKRIGIISICGPYRSGKSYFMSSLLGQKNAFKVDDDALKECTHGVWMSTAILKCDDDFAIILLDTEGTDNVEEGSGTTTANILILTSLLSSYFIFNTKAPVKKEDCNKLQFITSISSLLLSRELKHNTFDISKYFPDFLWLIRDMTGKNYLQNYPDPTKYLKENILVTKPEIAKAFPSVTCKMLPHPGQDDPNKTDIPHFDGSILEVCKYIRNEVKAKSGITKQEKSVPVTADTLITVIKHYLASINDMKLPNIENAYFEATKLHLKNLADQLIDIYHQEMGELKMPLEDPHYPDIPIESKKSHPGTILDFHFKYYSPKLEDFSLEFDKYNSPTEAQGEDNFLYQFKKRVHEILQKLRDENRSKSKELCEDIMNKLLFVEKIRNVDTLHHKYSSEAKGPLKNEVFKKHIKAIPGIPHDVKLFSLKSTSLRLTWKNPLFNAEEVERYEVCFHQQDKSSSTTQFSVSGDTLEKIFFSLQPKTRYNIKIWAISKHGLHGEYVEQTGITLADKPKPPSKPDIIYDDFTNNQVHVKMPMPPGKDNHGSPLKQATFCVTTSSGIQLSERNVDIKAFKPSQMISATLNIKEDPSNSSEYLVKAQVINDLGPSDWSDPNSLSCAHLTPGAPHNQKLIKTSSKLTVKLDKPKLFIRSLSHYYADINGANGIKVKVDENAIFPDLKPNTSYTIKVWAVNKFGYYSEPLTIHCKTLSSVPMTPKKPTIEFIPKKYNHINVSFDAPECFGEKLTKAELSIYPKTREDSPFILTLPIDMSKKPAISSVIDLDKCNFDSGNLICKVNVSNSIGPSEWSEPFIIKSTDLYPGSPKMNNSDPENKFGDGLLKIKWHAPMKFKSILDHYEVSLKCERDPNEHVLTVKKDVISHTFHDIHPNTLYHIQVNAVSESDKKRGITFDAISKALPPKVPEIPSVNFDPDTTDDETQYVKVTIKSPTLKECNWSPATRMKLIVTSDYTVKEIPHDDFDMEQRERVLRVALNHEECTYYSFKVQFFNEGGWSDYSKEAKLRVSELIPKIPQAVKFDPTSTEIVVTWNEPNKYPETVNHYKVTLKNEDTDRSCICDRANRIAKFDNLLPGTEYEITIIAVSDNDYRESKPYKVSTNIAPPNKPQLDHIKLYYLSPVDATAESEMANEFDAIITKPELKDCNGEMVNEISIKVDACLIKEDAEDYEVKHTWKTENLHQPLADGEENFFKIIRFNLPNCSLVKDIIDNPGFKLYYNLRFKFSNSAGCSELSGLYVIPGGDFIPGNPQKFEFEGIGSDVMKLTWGRPIHNFYSVMEYEVRIIDCKRKGYYKYFFVPRNQTAAIISELDTNTDYKFSIQSRNYSDESFYDEKISPSLQDSTKHHKALGLAASISAGILGGIGFPITAVVYAVKKAFKSTDDDESTNPGPLVVLPPVAGYWAGTEIYTLMSEEGTTKAIENEYQVKYSDLEEIPDTEQAKRNLTASRHVYLLKNGGKISEKSAKMVSPEITSRARKKITADTNPQAISKLFGSSETASSKTSANTDPPEISLTARKDTDSHAISKAAGSTETATDSL